MNGLIGIVSSLGGVVSSVFGHSRRKKARRAAETAARAANVEAAEALNKQAIRQASRRRASSLLAPSETSGMSPLSQATSNSQSSPSGILGTVLSYRRRNN